FESGFPVVKPLAMSIRSAVALTLILLFGVLRLSAFGEQMHSQLVVDGLKRAVAFVQDPSAANVQFVVEQGGRVRPVVNGRLQDQDYLNISDVISRNTEGGLLGLAFAPDYATSG